MASRRDGTLPPWIVEASGESTRQQFVRWFNLIWEKGDPANFNEDVFASRSVLVDPLGASWGSKQAADMFRHLFRYFPSLRGEVISWGSNDREIFVNWRFKIAPSNGAKPLLVPVVDKFGFIDGRVSWRLAYFDLITLFGYLSKTYGLCNLVMFLWSSVKQSRKGGGTVFLPRLLLNLVSGIFHGYTGIPPLRVSPASVPRGSAPDPKTRVS